MEKIVDILKIPQHKNNSLLYQRLETFDITKWFMKPQFLCSLECARKGWTLLKLDTLQCLLCNNTVQPNEALDLITGHKHDCYYRQFTDIFDGKIDSDEFNKRRAEWILHTGKGLYAAYGWEYANYGAICRDCNRKVVINEEFDPIEEHRIWCHWRQYYKIMQQEYPETGN